MVKSIKDVFLSELQDLKRVLKNSKPDKSLIKKAQAAIKRKGNLNLWNLTISALYITVSEQFANKVANGIKKGFSDIEVKAPKDTWKDTVLGWLKKNSSTKVVNITNTTTNKLRNILTEGVSLGESIDELATRVDKLYLEQIIPNRSVVIARTEVISASNLGSRAGAISTGLKLDKQWIATMDKRTRDAHSSVDGQTKDLNKPYNVNGELLMFPGDTGFGASAENVIQCRCTEGYIAK